MELCIEFIPAWEAKFLLIEGGGWRANDISFRALLENDDDD